MLQVDESTGWCSSSPKHNGKIKQAMQKSSSVWTERPADCRIFWLCEMKTLRELFLKLVSSRLLKEKLWHVCDSENETLIWVQRSLVDLDLLQSTSVPPPELNPEMLWQSPTSFLTPLFFTFLLCSTIGSRRVIFFSSFIQILPHNIVHKHNQIKNLQKLQLDNRQTDIKKCYNSSFFQCFFHIVIAYYLKSNMATLYGNTVCVGMWTNCSFWNSTSVWTIHVKYFFFLKSKWRPVKERKPHTQTHGTKK